jgi:hypothetical protein
MYGFWRIFGISVGTIIIQIVLLLFNIYLSYLACPHPVQPVHILFNLSTSYSDYPHPVETDCPHPVQTVQNPKLYSAPTFYGKMCQNFLTKICVFLANIELFQAEQMSLQSIHNLTCWSWECRLSWLKKILPPRANAEISILRSYECSK